MVISGSGLEATPTFLFFQLQGKANQIKTRGSGRAFYRKCGEYKLFLWESESFERLTYK